MTFHALQKVLQKYAAEAQFMHGDNLTLNRMWPALKLLGNPQDTLRVVHIAGTSGKTSTAYYVARLLQSAGATVGLTISPHVDSVTERIQINGKSISEEAFAEAFEEFHAPIRNAKLPLSYFELLVAFELWYFARQKVDYAVIETGMGGLLDATNVITRSDKVCIITDIGLDHMHVLGNTVEEIASQKAGIVHKGNQVFCFYQTKEIQTVIDSRITRVGAELHLVEQPFKGKIETQHLPLFQQRNLDLAHAAIIYIAKRDALVINTEKITDLIIPARMEIISLLDGSNLVMDGAHNQQKMAAFVDSMHVRFPDQKAMVLLALKTGKEYKAVIDELHSLTSSVIVTTFSTSQDMPLSAQDPQIIAKYCTEVGIDCQVELDHHNAINKLLASGQSLKVITGSFYLLGQLRPLLADKH